MKKVAILASGGGSNAEAIVNYLENSQYGEVKLILTENPNAGVLERAERLGVEARIFEMADFRNPQGNFFDWMKDAEIDLIVLAGFLKLVPEYLVKAFPDRIVNIHPALLPAYGGKGMYGMNVHRAVEAAGEEFSGITIHFVNEQYDKGAPILQEKCKVKGLPADEIAAEVLKLEHFHFPRTVEKVLQEL